MMRLRADTAEQTLEHLAGEEDRTCDIVVEVGLICGSKQGSRFMTVISLMEKSSKQELTRTP